MQTDLHKFSDKRIKTVQETIRQYGTPVTLDLTLVKNKKDVIGSVWAEADKLKITEDHLKTWHDNIDQIYIVKDNRTVLKILHNTIYPTGKTKRFASLYRVRILGMKTSGKPTCGKFPQFRYGRTCFSNSRVSRI
jgi:hypothetical protein